MKKLAAVSGLLLILISCWGMPTEARWQDQTLAIDQYIHAEMQALRIPGLTLGVVRDGVIYYTQGYGRSNSQGEAMTADTPLLIASLSKSVTALAVLQSVADGKVDLDLPISAYIPWLNSRDGRLAEVTVRQLLRQTSGIPSKVGLNTPPHEMTLQERVASMSQVSLTAQPGERWQYSNLNYDILGLVVELVNKQSYGEYLQQRLLEPLGMMRTTTDPATARTWGLAEGHRSFFGLSVPTEVDFPQADLPAGMILSTANDMARYVAMHLDSAKALPGAFLSSELLSQLWSTEDAGEQPAYGMGWFVSDQEVWHTGDFVNYRAAMLLRPEQGTGVVVMLNYGSLLESGIALQTARGVLSILAGDRPGSASGLLTWLVPFLLLPLTMAGAVDLCLAMSTRRRKLERRFVSRGLRLLLSALLALGAPAAIGTTLPFLISLQPDVGYLLASSATLFALSGGLGLTKRPVDPRAQTSQFGRN